ncbi:MAG: polyprenyl synthetase family protein [Bauldia sp.]
MLHPQPATSAAFEKALAGVAAAVDRVLDGVLPKAGDGVPARLAEAMRYAALGGGKRLRPYLLVESARLLGVDDERPLHAAAALECIHSYSLVHDDLPAMDDDDLRRGRPTVHRAYDEATGILVGDGLQTLAFEIMASDATEPDPAVRLRLVKGLAAAAGAAGMVGGQALDIEGEHRQLDEAAIVTLQEMKTGALFRFAAGAGAILGRASPAEADALSRFGRAFGAAFQLADDLLDHGGNIAVLGKAFAKDADRGKPTLVVLLGEDAARDRLAALTAEAEAALAVFGEAAASLAAAIRFVAGRG